MRRVKQLFVLLVLVLSVTVTGAQVDRVQIVASYTILGDVVMNVTGDAADISVLMPVGADPHTFEPTPRDLTRIADADIVFTNGAFFEEGLLEAIENAGADVPMVEVSSCVGIIPFGASGHDHDDEDHSDDDHDDEDHSDDNHDGEVHEHDGQAVAMLTGLSFADVCANHQAEFETVHEMREADEDHGDDEDHKHESVAMGPLYTLECGGGHNNGDDEENEDHDDHAEGNCDPHVWMQPHNVMYWTMLIRDTLVEMDPANAATYTANAEAYILELDALVHDFIIAMVNTVPEENRILVTNHESLGYFAERFDFEIVTTVLPGGATGAEASAADVAAIIDTINAEGVPAIFAETSVSDTVTSQIAAETGADLFVLYSGSLGEADSPAATYLDYITYNVTTIVEALGGGMS